MRNEPKTLQLYPEPWKRPCELIAWGYSLEHERPLAPVTGKELRLQHGASQRDGEVRYAKSNAWREAKCAARRKEALRSRGRECAGPHAAGLQLAAGAQDAVGGCGKAPRVLVSGPENL